jgi:hypothetical protein
MAHWADQEAPMNPQPSFREKYHFPSIYWNANLTELFERAAYY